MARIPSPEDLGPVASSFASGRPMGSGPENFVGPALQRLGGAVTQSASEMAIAQRIIGERERQEQTFNAASNFQQFQNDWTQKEQQLRGNMPPGGGNATATFRQQYRQAAADFASGLSPAIRGRFNPYIYDLEGKLTGRLGAAEVGEQQRYAGVKQDGLDNDFLDTISRNKDDPAAQDTAEKQLYAFNRTNPGLSPIERDNRLRVLPDKIAVARGQAVLGDKDARGAILNPGQTGSLFDRMENTESSGDPTALSPKGAMGLMQVTAPAIQDVARNSSDPTIKAVAHMTPEQQQTFFATPEGQQVNRQIGRTYFKMMLADPQIGGDVQAALIAYNAGAGVAHDWLRKGRDNDVLPKETQAYVQKVLGGDIGPGAGPSADTMVGQDVGINSDDTGSPAGRTPFVNAQGQGYAAPSRVITGSADMANLSPSAAGMLDGIAKAGLGFDLKVTSGYRDPARNAAAGGAQGSQHLHGNAIDFDVSGWTDDQKAKFLSTAIANGARGVGIYNSGRAIHLDTRQNPAFWGPNPAGAYKGASLDMAPAWARPVLTTLFKGGGSTAGTAVAAAATPGKRMTPADFPDGGFSQAQDFFRQQSPNASPGVINALASEAVKAINGDMQATKQDQATVRNLMQTDQASIRGTGQEVSDLTPDQVSSVLGPDAADEFSANRLAAHQFYAQTGDFERLPETEIENRLRQMLPQAGSSRYLQQQQDFQSAQQMASQIIADRMKDPAAAVANFPQVQAASQNTDLAKPDTMFPVIGARMAAQTALGIPPQQQSPMTRAEAQTFAAPLKNALPGTERQVLKDVITALDATYGDQSQRALEFMLQTAKVDKETSQAAASVFRRLGLGQQVTSRDGENLDVAATNDAVTSAASPLALPAAGSAAPAPVGRFPTAAQRAQMAAPPQARLPVPDQGAIDMLLADPSPAKVKWFDSAYKQPGLAQKVLDAGKAGTSRLTPEQLSAATQQWNADQAQRQQTPQGAFEAGVMQAVTPPAPGSVRMPWQPNPDIPAGTPAQASDAFATGVGQAFGVGAGESPAAAAVKRLFGGGAPDIPAAKPKRKGPQ